MATTTKKAPAKASAKAAPAKAGNKKAPVEKASAAKKVEKKNSEPTKADRIRKMISQGKTTGQILEALNKLEIPCHRSEVDRLMKAQAE